MIVIDASLAAKLILDEADSDRADAWYLDLSEQPIAPDLIVIEVTQAIVRRVNDRQAAVEQGLAGLDAWRSILRGGGIGLVRSGPEHVHAAAELAMRLGHPVKDCVYLALAIERGVDLATCDVQFAAKARTIHPPVKLLADYA